ncbi:Glycosyltransferase involved in cell wall bisynthesis [Actinobaculum suis]|uniref:Family 2 glycosyl transferase n=1 Tax=Actinobaculum suis TaxID=1657 RepID=A0A0K9ET89_9ACTO|nr:glycosyltransferase family 2 protein [Actinobaculum suis]KMY23027.1 glycosyl transferase family 2 [Actinobaculum suis]MDY5153528.1 glycosyltransferase family 2 protein [Actinobaculum suis]OCA93480.1 glycosyl transferase family 2 [Actinobaculum suis]OCA95235.1 glycosyl transferase family 2 [Actinobaculum suis]SDE52840.1 Glycosyltransferase involved in cell wall bisynthesis [Actinobaculum suis]
MASCSFDGTGLAILIPAWNEEEALPAVLAEIHEYVPQAHVVVIDDGSRDSTSQVARAHGATALTLPLNLGVGGAMRAGYRYAWRAGYEMAIQVDADGQHRPADIAKLVQTMQETGADLVIGARFAGVGNYEVRGPRAWAMSLLSGILSRICKVKLTDTTSGFKLANRRTIGVLAEEMPAEYLGDTIEALVIAAKHNLRVAQVGVEMRERIAGQPSHNVWKSAKFLLRGLISMAVAATRPREKELNKKEEGRQ